MNQRVVSCQVRRNIKKHKFTCYNTNAIRQFHSYIVTVSYMQKYYMGAQWLSGRVLDTRPRGRGFEPHQRHCVVVLEQDTFILA